jgi:electron transfer flavoprotein beta subunit
MAAKKKEVKVVPVPAIAAPRQKILSIHVPQKSKQTRVLAGSPAESAKELVRVLRDDVRVI